MSNEKIACAQKLWQICEAIVYTYDIQMTEETNNMRRCSFDACHIGHIDALVCACAETFYPSEIAWYRNA